MIEKGEKMMTRESTIRRAKNLNISSSIRSWQSPSQLLNQLLKRLRDRNRARAHRKINATVLRPHRRINRSHIAIKIQKVADHRQIRHQRLRRNQLSHWLIALSQVLVKRS